MFTVPLEPNEHLIEYQGRKWRIIVSEETSYHQIDQALKQLDIKSASGGSDDSSISDTDHLDSIEDLKKPLSSYHFVVHDDKVEFNDGTRSLFISFGRLMRFNKNPKSALAIERENPGQVDLFGRVKICKNLISPKVTTLDESSYWKKSVPKKFIDRLSQLLQNNDDEISKNVISSYTRVILGN